jgi:hypothetical protein
VKRVLLLLKAAYNIGGHTISAEAIQSSILGCKMSHPGQVHKINHKTSKHLSSKNKSMIIMIRSFHFS